MIQGGENTAKDLDEFLNLHKKYKQMMLNAWDNYSDLAGPVPADFNKNEWTKSCDFVGAVCEAWRGGIQSFGPLVKQLVNFARTRQLIDYWSFVNSSIDEVGLEETCSELKEFLNIHKNGRDGYLEFHKDQSNIVFVTKSYDDFGTDCRSILSVLNDRLERKKRESRTLQTGHPAVDLICKSLGIHK